MTSWGLSHEGLGIRSVAEFAVSYLCMKATERGREGDKGREGDGEWERGEEFWARRKALAQADRLHYPLGKIQL